jgi:hypothetical protein
MMTLTLLLLLQDEDFAAAVKKSQELKSYAFKLKLAIEGDNAGTPTELAGWHHAEKGTYTKSDQGEVFKKGAKTAVRSMDEEWMSLADWQQAHADPGGAFAAGLIKGLKPPHDALKGADKRLSKVERAADREKVGDEECAVWSGPLNDDAAEVTFLFKNMLAFVEDRELKATLKVWVDSEKRPRKWTLKHDVKGTAAGNEVRVTVTWTTELSKMESVDDAVPEGAAKIVGE